MAPLGILTTMTAAIRVHGVPWMRAVIGRARENRATVELELMSSTSHDMCEIWNGHGIIRTMGAPEVKQIIYLEDYKEYEDLEGLPDPKTYGLFTVEEAERKEILRKQGMYTAINGEKLHDCELMHQYNTDHDPPLFWGGGNSVVHQDLEYLSEQDRKSVV